MFLKNPVVVYTAETNVEAHMIVVMLQANDVPAYVVEDQSGASFWAFGIISQYHKPNIWVDESTIQKATDLIRDFEGKKKTRNTPAEETGDLHVICEDCGKTNLFPNLLDGTTQECRQCGAYVDVGDLPWEDDYGEPEDRTNENDSRSDD